MNQETLNYLAKATGVACDIIPNMGECAIRHLANVTEKQFADRGCDMSIAEELVNGLNPFGADETAPVEPAPAADLPGDTNGDGVYGRTEIHKMRKAELITLCGIEGLSTDGTVADLKEALFKHFGI